MNQLGIEPTNSQCEGGWSINRSDKMNKYRTETIHFTRTRDQWQDKRSYRENDNCAKEIRKYLENDKSHVHVYCTVVRYWAGRQEVFERERNLSDTEWQTTILTLSIWINGLSKQCRPRSDAADCSIWSGSTLFATHPIDFRYINI